MGIKYNKNVINIGLKVDHVSHLRSIRKRIYNVLSQLTAEAYVSDEPIKIDDLGKYNFHTVEKGFKWAKRYGCAWFRFKGRLPEIRNDKKAVALIDIMGEGLVYNKDGIELQGITNVLTQADIFQSVKAKQVVDLDCLTDNEGNVQILVDAGNNNLLMSKNKYAVLNRCEIAEVNKEIFDYYYDYLTLYLLMGTMDKSNERLKFIDDTLSNSYALIKDWSPENVNQARKMILPLIEDKSNDDLVFTAIGHAHLDLAWLWPIRETKRKSARTLMSAINNFKKYDDYIIGISQPQQLEWIKNEYPQVYEKVKDAVAQGKIDTQGGMWVECDCNLPSGESLIRQFYYGKKFWKDEFNKDVRICWLPDAFGYNYNLPQIMKKCGIDYFYTIKMTWNTVNQFPHKSFIWKGLDGSEVIAHMAPQGDYNSSASPIAIKKGTDNYKEKNDIKTAILCYGAGDGGGGPGEFHLETLKRDSNINGLSKVIKGQSIDFFKKLEEFKDKLAVYDNELYLEKHQGTFTTQSDNKKLNRKIEVLLHNVEMLGTLSYLNGKEYPDEMLDRIWKEVLLYQFHDILPGSSINRVYKESVARYIEMSQELMEKRNDIIKSLSSADCICAVNATSFNRSEWLKYDQNWYRAIVKPYSSAVLNKHSEFSKVFRFDKYTIENDKIIVKFNNSGEIISFIEKETNKEICGKYLNRLTVYKDKKMHYNAWDIKDNYYKRLKNRFILQRSNVYTDGPMLVKQNIYYLNKSTLIQNIILFEGENYIRFDTTVNWQETHRMLRADFIPSVYSDKVKCDIQFGSIDRPTTEKDSIEKAQFEIAAHKYVNLDGEDYGLALINDCKYGYRVKNGLISMNLLRSPVYPDKTADRGEHSFTYILYPHKEKIYESNTVRLAYSLNNPLQISEKEVLFSSLVLSDNGNIIIETIKKAYNDDGIIIRAYEQTGKENTAKIDIGFKYSKAYECDMLENIICEIDLKKVEFKPFEVKTILLKKSAPEAKKAEKEQGIIHSEAETIKVETEIVTLKTEKKTKTANKETKSETAEINKEFSEKVKTEKPAAKKTVKKNDSDKKEEVKE